MRAEWPPAPPDGYRMNDPEYEQPWYVTVGLYVWILGVLVAVPALIIAVHGLDTTTTIYREVFLPDSFKGLVMFLGWIALTFTVFIGAHELLHALAGQWFGLRTVFDFEYQNPLNWTPEVITHGGFQSRGESLAIVLAPLVLLTPTAVIALVLAQNQWIIASAVVIALANSAGAVGDLASAAVFWHLPDGELVYHDSDGRRQYYGIDDRGEAELRQADRLS